MINYKKCYDDHIAIKDMIILQPQESHYEDDHKDITKLYLSDSHKS